MAELKERIFERMEAKNFSIAELERRAGLSIHSVRNILKGRIKKPSAQSLQKIANALDCSIVDLISDGSSNDGYVHETLKKMRSGPSLDYPELMVECTKSILKLLNSRKENISVEEFMDITKKVYFYSAKEEPRKTDLRFAQWLIETQLDDPKTKMAISG